MVRPGRDPAATRLQAHLTRGRITAGEDDDDHLRLHPYQPSGGRGCTAMSAPAPDGGLRAADHREQQRAGPRPAPHMPARSRSTSARSPTTCSSTNQPGGRNAYAR
jgi:hypothetical protein